ncbi:hypothetical protein KBD87_00460 [Candidatus Saccharibacteria bacterium]|nr:hypothetical protein [Candidatus Saccharibacteria bacterium]
MRRVSKLLFLLIFFAVWVVAGPQVSFTHAGQLDERSLKLQGTGGNGGADPNVTANNLFTFTLASAHNSSGGLGSIKFTYCTTATGACTAPTGVSVSGATVGDNSSGDVQGFTMQSSPSGNSFYITRTLANATAGDIVIVRIDGIHNPTAANETFFVRVVTYDGSTNASSGAKDTGTVAASTADPIVITGTMPESLIFCTGETISTSSGVPDCSTATPANNIVFNKLFSSTDTATATSQMAASTNAESGYAITVNGATLTSGAHTITAIITPGGVTSNQGTGQFGINLRANATPSVGTEVAPSANGTTIKGQAVGDYATVDKYKFTSGETVANAANGGSSGPTNAQIYTVSYIVNVPGSQAVGDYTSTLTYICTPTY